MDQQMSLFDMAPEEMDAVSDGMLHVVNAEFKEESRVTWKDLFNGFDE